MENNYSQRFNYARIRLFKNYSTLGERSVIYETQNPDRTSLDPFDNFIGGTDSFSEEGELPISTTIKPKKFTIPGRVTQDKCPILHNLNLYRKALDVISTQIIQPNRLLTTQNQVTQQLNVML